MSVLIVILYPFKRKNMIFDLFRIVQVVIDIAVINKSIRFVPLSDVT